MESVTCRPAGAARATPPKSAIVSPSRHAVYFNMSILPSLYRCGERLRRSADRHVFAVVLGGIVKPDDAVGHLFWNVSGGVLIAVHPAVLRRMAHLLAARDRPHPTTSRCDAGEGV